MAVTQARTAPLFEQFMAFRRFSGGLAFSNDGAYVYFISNISGQFNLWRVPVEGGWPDQLTAFADETVRFISVSPVDARIALGADTDGDEFHQIYLLDPDGGWPEKLTDDAQVQHYIGGNAWSPDGTKLLYAANARTPTDMEVWIRDLDSGETRPVFGEGMYAFPGGWSPDGSKVLTLDFRHNSDTRTRSSSPVRGRPTAPAST
jgi:Tol biopolymer transport system component